MTFESRAGRDRVRVRPVAHEGRVAADEGVVRLALLVGGDAARRRLADVGAEHVEHRRGLRVVDRRLAVVDELAAARRREPLERVAGQALVRVALEHEAVEVRVRLLLAVLDLLRHREQLGPGRRRRLVAVLLQQVGAVVEDPEVAEPRHRDELPVDRVVRDDARPRAASPAGRASARGRRGTARRRPARRRRSSPRRSSPTSTRTPARAASTTHPTRPDAARPSTLMPVSFVNAARASGRACASCRPSRRRR